MFLHKPEVYFADQLDKTIPCRCCGTLFQIKDGVCYEGWVVSSFNEDGSPDKIAWVKMMLCLIHPRGFYTCVTQVAVPDEMGDNWRVPIQ